MRAAKVVFVNDRRCVAVGDTVLVLKPRHLVVEPQEGGAVLKFAEPLGEFATCALGNPSQQVLMRLLGVV